MWSLGCVLGELYTRRPLLPGHHLGSQLERINNMVGSPSQEDLW
jgi:cyclin-dependent kinase 12/13